MVQYENAGGAPQLMCILPMQSGIKDVNETRGDLSCLNTYCVYSIPILEEGVFSYCIFLHTCTSPPSGTNVSNWWKSAKQPASLKAILVFTPLCTGQTYLYYVSFKIY